MRSTQSSEPATTRRTAFSPAAAACIAALLLLPGCSRLRLQSPIAAASGPPAAFVQTTSDVKLTRVIDVRDDLAKEAAFKAARELLAKHYTIDVEDQHAGFLMTPWQATLTHDGVPDLRYRTRVIIRFLGQDWKQVSVRAEANWQHGEGWDMGYDSRLLDEVLAELRTVIGKMDR